MNITSVVVRASPEHFPELHESLSAISGVEIHGESADNGRMVVTVEDGEGYAVSDSLTAINLTRHVLSITLAYEYTDQGLDTGGMK